MAEKRIEEEIITVRINTFRGEKAVPGITIRTENTPDGKRVSHVLVPSAEDIPAATGRPSWVEYHTAAEMDAMDPRVRKLLQEGVLVRGEPEDPIEKVVGAILRLDRDAPELWTDAGLPLVKAVEAELGADISADERDIAWEMVKERRLDEGRL